MILTKILSQKSWSNRTILILSMLQNQSNEKRSITRAISSCFNHTIFILYQTHNLQNCKKCQTPITNQLVGPLQHLCSRSKINFNSLHGVISLVKMLVVVWSLSYHVYNYEFLPILPKGVNLQCSAPTPSHLLPNFCGFFASFYARLEASRNPKTCRLCHRFRLPIFERESSMT